MSGRLCQFVVDPGRPGMLRCTRPDCGNRQYGTDPTRAVARCRSTSASQPGDVAIIGDPLDCVHLVEATGETVQVPCNCPGMFTTLWECDLFGRVTPLARVEGIKSCAGCGEWEANAECGMRNAE